MHIGLYDEPDQPLTPAQHIQAAIDRHIGSYPVVSQAALPTRMFSLLAALDPQRACVSRKGESTYEAYRDTVGAAKAPAVWQDFGVEPAIAMRRMAPAALPAAPRDVVEVLYSSLPAEAWIRNQ